MANTDVTLLVDQGTFVPSTDSIPVVAGNTFSLKNTGSRQALLFFSPAAVSVLSPAPGDSLPIAAGGESVFTFVSSNPGAYSIYFGTSPDDAPPVFPSAAQPVLALMVTANQVAFPVNQPKTGH